MLAVWVVLYLALGFLAMYAFDKRHHKSLTQILGIYMVWPIALVLRMMGWRIK
jgi:hypothetical protein